MKKYPADGAHERARALRRNMTEAERHIWQILRSSQIGGQGYRVRRFWNNDVLSNLEGVHATIARDLGCHPHPDPPPSWGREIASNS